jgi:2-haloacid dehalogenase
VILLFDLNGTLTDPSAMGEPWGTPELGPAALDRAIGTAMVDALTGEYRPFSEHLRAAIIVEARRRALGLDRVDDALARAAALPLRPDVEAGLTALSGGGHRLAVLTNSGAEGGRATLESAGIADRFEAVLGVDAVRSYKPHPSTYRHALEALGAPGDEVMLVAAHQWDVTGALRAGLRGAWIDRGGEPPSPVAATPDLRVTRLGELAAQLGERAAAQG